MPWFRAALEEKCLSPVCTKLRYDKTLILVLRKLRLRELGKTRLDTHLIFFYYDPSGRKIRVFWGLEGMVLGVWMGDIQRVVPGKGQGRKRAARLLGFPLTLILILHANIWRGPGSRWHYLCLAKGRRCSGLPRYLNLFLSSFGQVFCV